MERRRELEREIRTRLRSRNDPRDLYLRDQVEEDGDGAFDSFFDQCLP